MDSGMVSQRAYHDTTCALLSVRRLLSVTPAIPGLQLILAVRGPKGAGTNAWTRRLPVQLWIGHGEGGYHVNGYGKIIEGRNCLLAGNIGLTNTKVNVNMVLLTDIQLFTSG